MTPVVFTGRLLVLLPTALLFISSFPFISGLSLKSVPLPTNPFFKPLTPAVTWTLFYIFTCNLFAVVDCFSLGAYADFSANNIFNLRLDLILYIALFRHFIPCFNRRIIFNAETTRLSPNHFVSFRIVPEFRALRPNGQKNQTGNSKQHHNPPGLASHPIFLLEKRQKTYIVRKTIFQRST